MNLILASGSRAGGSCLLLYTNISPSASVTLTKVRCRPLRLPIWWNSWPGASACRFGPAPGAVVIGCDTVVDVNGEVFGKPHSEEDAKRMLRALSGATHEVHTGVCISDGARTESFVDSCRVTFFAGERGDRLLRFHRRTLR